MPVSPTLQETYSAQRTLEGINYRAWLKPSIIVLT
jgi:hypothetical protein